MLKTFLSILKCLDQGSAKWSISILGVGLTQWINGDQLELSGGSMMR